MALRYKGKDERTDWLPGVPARNLNDDDIKELGLNATQLRHLVASGLYAEVAPRVRRDEPEEVVTEAEPVPERSVAADEERE